MKIRLKIDGKIGCATMFVYKAFGDLLSATLLFFSLPPDCKGSRSAFIDIGYRINVNRLTLLMC